MKRTKVAPVTNAELRFFLLAILITVSHGFASIVWFLVGIPATWQYLREAWH